MTVPRDPTVPDRNLALELVRSARDLVDVDFRVRDARVGEHAIEALAVGAPARGEHFDLVAGEEVVGRAHGVRLRT